MENKPLTERERIDALVFRLGMEFFDLEGCRRVFDWHPSRGYSSVF